MPIYSAPLYQMGDDDAMELPSSATTPITSSQAAAARAALEGMRAGLLAWRTYRQRNDLVAAGQGHRVRDAVLRRPGARAADVPARVAQVQQLQRRRGPEQRLAVNLHRLLVEVGFDPDDLPDPDIRRNPNAAADLADIVISGSFKNESPRPTPTGFIWLWPAVVVVGVVAMVIISKIRSDAEVAKEQERLECVKSGKCTDSGFWFKTAGVVIVGWFLWDKVGLRDRLTGALGKRSAATRR